MSGRGVGNTPCSSYPRVACMYPYLDHRMSMARSTRQCKPLIKKLRMGVKTSDSSGLLIQGMFFRQLEGRAAKISRCFLFPSRHGEVRLLHSTSGLCCQHGRGGEERGCAGTSHISASPESLLIPASEPEEKQSFIFTLFSCLQIKVKAPVL